MILSMSCDKVFLFVNNKVIVFLASYFYYLFNYRRSVVACHLPTSETVPMLVPNPGDVARVHIGEKDMDQVKLQIFRYFKFKTQN
jgi:hypothetical protein